jgi:hypothetical protein
MSRAASRRRYCTVIDLTGPCSWLAPWPPTTTSPLDRLSSGSYSPATVLHNTSICIRLLLLHVPLPRVRSALWEGSGCAPVWASSSQALRRRCNVLRRWSVSSVSSHSFRRTHEDFPLQRCLWREQRCVGLCECFNLALQRN